MTWIWLGIVLIAIAGIVLVILQSQDRLGGTPKQKDLPPLKRTIFTLQVGDIVQYQDSDWVVEGQLTFNENGYIWLDYILRDQDFVRWLSVEEEDRVEVCWMEPISDLEISRIPPKSLTYAGQTYQMDSSGTARMSQLGAVLNKQGQTCNYYDYSGPDDRVLSVEVWDGDVEITVGRKIRPSSLTFLPGDGRKVYDD